MSTQEFNNKRTKSDEFNSSDAIENYNTKNYVVSAAVSFIKRNFSSRVTLRDLERITGVSSFQIIRAFRQQLHTTPHSYLLRCRIERGTEMLRNGDSAAAIAVDLGFVDQSHFIRHFKRQHGCSPRNFLTRSRAVLTA